MLKFNEFRSSLARFLNMRPNGRFFTTDMSLKQFDVMKIGHLNPARNHERSHKLSFAFILLFRCDDVCVSLPKRTLVAATLDQQRCLVRGLSLKRDNVDW